jgi:hypothetical protein
LFELVIFSLITNNFINLCIKQSIFLLITGLYQIHQSTFYFSILR